MSSHCLYRLGSALPKRVTHQPFFSTRLQSQSAQKGQSSGLRNLLIYGGVVINGVVIGSVWYANHNPGFKHSADSYVPGFGALVDQSTAIWGTGQTVIEEWWKKVKGMSVVDDKTETPNKQKDHILLAIKKTVEEDTIRKADGKTPEKTSSPSQSSSKPGATLVSSSKPPASSDKNDNQATLAEQEKHTAAAKTSPVTSSLSPSSDKNDKEAALAKQEKHTGATKTSFSNAENDKQTALAKQEKHTAGAKTSQPLTNQPPSSDKNDKQKLSKQQESAKTSPSAKTSTPAQTTSVLPASANKSDSSAPSNASSASGPSNDIKGVPPPSKVEVTDKSASTSEADELSRAYKHFATESDSFLSSQQELAQAIAVHYLQQQEAIKTPMSEEQRKTIAGSIVGTKQAVDIARKKVEQTKKTQREAADALETAISVAKDAAMVKQVYEKVQSYMEKIEEAGKAIIDTEARERQWFQEQARSSDQSCTDETSLDDQLEMEIQKRVVEALKNQRQLFDKEMSAMLSRVVEEKSKELKETLVRKEEEMERVYEQKLKDELLMQSRAHRYHLHETLEQQADQLSQEWSEELSTKLRDVEEAHLQEMVAALNELKGVQSTISTVVEADKATRRQQSVRTACDALTRAIVTADSNPDPLQKHSISSQVSVLLQTGKEDQFITTVLSAIPNKAVVDGISSEAGLKKRFKHVRKICQRVALVPEGGAGLGTYLISFLQSLLIINIGRSRVTDGTDTFDILREADTFITQGQLERAVSLMNQLQGEPKRVARDWLREATLYLETRQAVTVVAEYLAAAGISVLK